MSLTLLAKRLFPALECAIVFVVSCLAFVSFHSSSLVVQIVSLRLKFNRGNNNCMIVSDF